MKTGKESIIVGLALFAMFFGAGSLIFPPYLGMVAGDQWFLGFMCFFIADIGLSFVTIVAMMKGSGHMSTVTGYAGRIPAKVINTAAILCIGPMLAIPRTCATSFEMAVKPLTSSIGLIVVSIVYFAIVYVLTIRPSKVVDIVGKFLTPLMLVMLAVLIIKGIVDPAGPISMDQLVDSVVANGITSGYQAMDVFGALGFAIIIIAEVERLGYKEASKERTKVVAGACIVAGVGLFLVYCGLTYLGATVSTMYGVDVNQASLIVAIAQMLLGTRGAACLGIIVALACLTTAIGLTSACGAYFENLSNGKLKYGVMVLVITLFSALVSNIGLSAIIAVATPILSVLYPIILTLMICFFCSKWIKNNNLCKGAAIMAGITAFLTVLVSYGIDIGFIEKMPLYSSGLNWLPVALIGAIIGNFIKTKNSYVNLLEPETQGDA